MKRFTTLQFTSLVIAGLWVCCGCTRTASAALLPGFPDPPTSPEARADMFSSVASINYNAGTDIFTVTGSPINYYAPDATNHSDFEAVPVPLLSIVAEIDAAGNIGAGGGTLSIQGKITSLGTVNPVLLAGTLEQVGFQQAVAGAGLFQLVFGSLTGELASDYESGKAYVRLNAFDGSTAFDGDFSSSFSFEGRLLSSDTIGVPAPEPGAATLLLIAVAGVGAVRARTRRMRA